jgi:hypothetical protein
MSADRLGRSIRDATWYTRNLFYCPVGKRALYLVQSVIPASKRDGICSFNQRTVFNIFLLKKPLSLEKGIGVIYSVGCSLFIT